MNCDTCRTLLSAFQAGDLDAGQAREVAGHLSGCPDCTQELGAYQQLDALTSGLDRHAPSTRTVLRVKSASAFPVPPPPRKTDFGPVLDLAELAEFLRVDRETVEEYLDELPCFELGGRLLFRRQSIEEWIENRERSYGFERTESEINRILVADTTDKGSETWKI